MPDRRALILLVLGLLLFSAPGARAETFWSTQNGELLAFDFDFSTSVAWLTMQSSGDGGWGNLYFAVARHPATGDLWVNYYNNGSGRSAIGRLQPGAGVPETGFDWPLSMARALAFSPGGTLYALFSATGMFWEVATVNLETGATETVLSAPIGQELSGLAFHPQTGILYLAGSECPGCVAFVDTVTIPGYERARVAVGSAYGPPQPLFSNTGDLFVMMGNFYRVDGAAMVYAGGPPVFYTPFGPHYEYLYYGASPAEGTFGCVPALIRACLQNRRFSIFANYDATIFGGSSGYARTKLESDESVAFTFFGPGRGLELFVKVIDGCDFNGHYWVFAAGLTNVGVELRIRDTVGGTVYAVDREPGQEFGSVSDILAIPCGPASPPAF